MAGKGEEGEKESWMWGVAVLEYGLLFLLGSLTPALALGVRVCQFPIGYVSHNV